ncbi:hypothetical protein OMR58_22400 [Erwinia sp. INIA-01]|uniref:hypothetical protein n=1 Tax=Erwinia sp. INIA01 TaxID=2991500 RepID=UPI0022254793|nr:hypothetical protein [Erwinia sp. INIA01]MCW1877203.1 hypothetical protein [Erwinia sp. INIA01]
MNTHNVNTAASESSKTWVEQINTRHLPPQLAEEMRFLASLCDKEQRMLHIERLELIDGAGHHIADLVCNSVTDWSVPRPLIPAAVVAAWLLAKKMITSAFQEGGEAEWGRIEKSLRADLIVGFHHP